MGFAEESKAARDEFVRRVTRGMSAGSEHCYREFYEAYFDRLYRHLLCATRGREQIAREVMQNALVRVVRYIEPFEEEGRFWAWLRQVARSCLIDYARREQCRPEGSAVPMLEELVARGEQREEEPELMEALDKSLGELEPEELQMLKRVYFDELSQEQIAVLGQTTRKAVESRLGRIRRKLRKMIVEKLKEYAVF